ncbi:dephospho-CoA kinase [Brachybacterium huguangmaarense]|uniref:Dephospho-CoA kinase n=1 Tax=Brachybacterium huguangmaarense TaxID=1652028 RepID=A0ABY6G168_9MICO|nr:dephospho-CoA kinase [Brachybacterium huguangmaarense]UYG16414.1 dephospho-CoA kinase [Brachybacterium huguangmaarense]
MDLTRIGLTGGIGAGKSTVADIWRADGVPVIDLDAHSRAVLDVPGPGVEEAVARFGEEFRLPTGTIDRGALAALVFADAAARADLEAIVLSRVDDAVAAEERAARAAGHAVVVHDSPLLLEKERDGDYDAVVGVLAPRRERIARVVRDRGRTVEYVAGVLAAQASDLERIRRCDRLILNNAGRTVLGERARRALAAALAELAP